MTHKTEKQPIKRRRVQGYLLEDAYNRLVEAARAEGLTLSALVSTIATRYLAQRALERLGKGSRP